MGPDIGKNVLIGPLWNSTRTIAKLCCWEGQGSCIPLKLGLTDWEVSLVKRTLIVRKAKWASVVPCSKECCHCQQEHSNLIKSSHYSLCSVLLRLQFLDIQCKLGWGLQRCSGLELLPCDQWIEGAGLVQTGEEAACQRGMRALAAAPTMQKDLLKRWNRALRSDVWKTRGRGWK